MLKRCVITGLGVVAPNGIGKEKFWESIKNGNTGIKKISHYDTSHFHVRAAGAITDFNPTDFFSQETVYATVRFSQFAMVATKLGIKDANIRLKDLNSARVGVSMGTTTGGIEFMLDQHSMYLQEKSFENVHPFVFSKTVLNAGSSMVAIMAQARGPCSTFCSACAASADAIGFGLNSIRRGETDVMLVGGSDASIHPLIMEVCYNGGMISKKVQNGEIKVPQPFDKQRDGTVIGEGAAILVLEELEHAKNRGANIYAELVGYSSTCDAHHMVKILASGEEQARAILLALEDANIKPEEIGYINAHGTGTVSNDKIETQVIKSVFAEHASKIPISSTKSMTGHLFGAGAAIEAAICVLALHHGVLPPTINYETPDPECDLDYIPNTARKQAIRYALSNSFGFGGENSVLIFKKYE